MAKKSKPKKKTSGKTVKKNKPVVKRKKATKKTAKKANLKVKKAVKKVVKKSIKKPAKKASVKKTLKVPVKKSTVSKNKVTTKKSDKKPFQAHITKLKTGMRAPYFEGVDQNGNTVKSAELLGKTVILYFYPKDDTPGCTAEACSLRDEYQFLGNNNYAVIGVSADDVKSHKKFAEKFSLPFPLIADTNRTIIKAYDVWGSKQFMGRIFEGIVRTTFVIDPNGIIENVVNKVDTANHAKQLLEL